LAKIMLNARSPLRLSEKSFGNKVMKLTQRKGRAGLASKAAFSLIEVLVGMGVAGIMLGSLYAGFSSGFAVTQTTRENLRATQVMLEKMETIRLYRWEQVKEPGFIPPTFSAPYYAVGTNNTSGITYFGKISFSNPPINGSYLPNMTQITIAINWESGGVNRERVMTTFISRYGLQNYVY
jgi:prepilin-type N-terminal cleavage/methylation domain-containing protein